MGRSLREKGVKVLGTSRQLITLLLLLLSLLKAKCNPAHLWLVFKPQQQGVVHDVHRMGVWLPWEKVEERSRAPSMVEHLVCARRARAGLFPAAEACPSAPS